MDSVIIVYVKSIENQIESEQFHLRFNDENVAHAMFCLLRSAQGVTRIERHTKEHDLMHLTEVWEAVDHYHWERP
jgi:hypothetical protein